jgi:hypothetical protein
VKLEKHGLFNTMNKVEDAMKYADQIVNALPAAERMPAYTAIYVLYNSVVKHYEDDYKETDQEDEANLAQRDLNAEMEGV